MSVAPIDHLGAFCLGWSRHHQVEAGAFGLQSYLADLGMPQAFDSAVSASVSYPGPRMEVVHWGELLRGTGLDLAGMRLTEESLGRFGANLRRELTMAVVTGEPCSLGGRLAAPDGGEQRFRAVFAPVLGEDRRTHHVVGLLHVEPAVTASPAAYRAAGSPDVDLNRSVVRRTDDLMPSAIMLA